MYNEYSEELALNSSMVQQLATKKVRPLLIYDEIFMNLDKQLQNSNKK